MRSRGDLLIFFEAVFLFPASGFAQAPASQPGTAPEPAIDAPPDPPAGPGSGVTRIGGNDETGTSA